MLGTLQYIELTQEMYPVIFLKNFIHFSKVQFVEPVRFINL